MNTGDLTNQLNHDQKSKSILFTTVHFKRLTYFDVLASRLALAYKLF